MQAPPNSSTAPCPCRTMSVWLRRRVPVPWMVSSISPGMLCHRAATTGQCLSGGVGLDTAAPPANRCPLAPAPASPVGSPTALRRTAVMVRVRSPPAPCCRDCARTPHGLAALCAHSAGCVPADPALPVPGHDVPWLPPPPPRRQEAAQDPSGHVGVRWQQQPCPVSGWHPALCWHAALCSGSGDTSSSIPTSQTLS